MRISKLRPASVAFVRPTIRLRWTLVIVLLLSPAPFAVSRAQQAGPSDPSRLTPLQTEIEKERRRLNSSETEERRDALMSLGRMNRPESARAASLALKDSSAIVRATAARSVLALPADEAAALLLPLLQDRDWFVRQEAAYALGETRSRRSVSALLTLLENEKEDGVRGAAVVALGQIGDERAVALLSWLLDRRLSASSFTTRSQRSKKVENEFVRRAAALSLGQIQSRAALPALISVLQDPDAPDDVRREAAVSLGLIGDPAAGPALNSILDARDPHLSRAASEAILKLTRRPTR